MPKFAANLTMLFQEVDFLDRFAAASSAGFKAIEFLFPYLYSTEDLKSRLDHNDLQQVLFNLPPGDWSAGERGIACLPDRKDEFKKGIDEAIHYAQALGVARVNCLAGIKPSELEYEHAFDTMVANLDYAARALAKENIELLVEPINSRVDMPGFFIDTLDKFDALRSAVNNENLGLQFDLYHMHIMHGNLLESLPTVWDQIKHIQFADNPGRHEPGTGEIEFQKVFKYLDDAGYEGFVSAEYRPKDDTVGSLTWLRTFN